MINASMATYNRKSVIQSALSIADQVDKLTIFHNSDNFYYPVDHPNVVNVRLKNNIGDRAKFLGWSNVGVTLTLDDDLIYADNYVSEMLRYLQYFKVVSLHGVQFTTNKITSYYKDPNKVKFHCLHAGVNSKSSKVDVVGTGVLAAKDLKLEVNDRVFKNGYMADLWFSYEMAKRKQDLYVINKKLVSYIDQPKGSTIFERYQNTDKKQTEIANKIKSLHL